MLCLQWCWPLAPLSHQLPDRPPLHPLRTQRARTPTCGRTVLPLLRLGAGDFWWRWLSSTSIEKTYRGLSYHLSSPTHDIQVWTTSRWLQTSTHLSLRHQLKLLASWSWSISQCQVVNHNQEIALGRFTRDMSIKLRHLLTTETKKVHCFRNVNVKDRSR